MHQFGNSDHTPTCAYKALQHMQAAALQNSDGHLRRQGIEPCPTAWKAVMLTTTPAPLFSRSTFQDQMDGRNSLAAEQDAAANHFASTVLRHKDSKSCEAL